MKVSTPRYQWDLETSVIHCADMTRQRMTHSSTVHIPARMGHSKSNSLSTFNQTEKSGPRSASATACCLSWTIHALPTSFPATPPAAFPYNATRCHRPRHHHRPPSPCYRTQVLLARKFRSFFRSRRTEVRRSKFAMGLPTLIPRTLS